MAVGSPRLGFNDPGGVSLYSRPNDELQPWELVSEISLFSTNIVKEPIEFDEFGISVSINEEFLFIGAHRDDEKNSDAGAVYVYHMNVANSAPVLASTLMPSLPSINEDDHENPGIKISTLLASFGVNGTLDADGDILGIAVMDTARGRWR